MAYLVKTEHHNGYRCSCCIRDWEGDEEWLPNREEALARVIPDVIPAESEWGGLKSIKVIDGSTAEVLASGEVSWPVNSPRGNAYRYTHWSGFIEGELFEVVEARGGKRVDKSWREILAELNEEDQQRRLGKAKRELEKAQEEVNKLQEKTE